MLLGKKRTRADFSIAGGYQPEAEEVLAEFDRGGDDVANEKVDTSTP